MKTSIDAAGRVLIPSKLRAAAALRPGARLEARLDGGRIVLEPAPLRVRIVQRGRFHVAEPAEAVPPLTEETVRDTLDRLRTGDHEP